MVKVQDLNTRTKLAFQKLHLLYFQPILDLSLEELNCIIQFAPPISQVQLKLIYPSTLSFVPTPLQNKYQIPLPKYLRLSCTFDPRDGVGYKVLLFLFLDSFIFKGKRHRNVCLKTFPDSGPWNPMLFKYENVPDCIRQLFYSLEATLDDIIFCTFENNCISLLSTKGKIIEMYIPKVFPMGRSFYEYG